MIRPTRESTVRRLTKPPVFVVAEITSPVRSNGTHDTGAIAVTNPGNITQKTKPKARLPGVIFGLGGWPSDLADINMKLSSRVKSEVNKINVGSVGDKDDHLASGMASAIRVHAQFARPLSILSPMETLVKHMSRKVATEG